MELGGSPHEISQVSFIITLLSHARHDITFSPYTRKWLLSATLAKILCIHYSIPQSLHFDGNDIVQALRRRKLLEKHNLCGVINDCFDDNKTGIYRVLSQDHNGKRESLFYFRHTNGGKRTHMTRARRKEISQLEAKVKGTKRIKVETPLITRQSKRLKLQDRRASTEVPPLQRPPSGSSSWLEERRTYHRTVTQNFHRIKKTTLPEGSTAKIIQDSLQKTMLVNLSSSRMTDDFIPQKLLFDSTIVSEKARSVLLYRRPQQDKVNLYWYSTEARQLFSPNLPEEENLFVHLQKRIADLNGALRVEKSFDELLDGNLTSEDLSHWEYKKISAKIRCLRKATELALQSMGCVEYDNWKGCCLKTVVWANDFGDRSIQRFIIASTQKNILRPKNPRTNKHNSHANTYCKVSRNH